MEDRSATTPLLSPTAVGPAPNPQDHPTSAPDRAPARPRRKGHRGGRRKKSRHKSFAARADDMVDIEDEGHSQVGGLGGRSSFYECNNMSTTSIESEALLDHRDQQHFLRPRRPSIMAPPGASLPSQHTPTVNKSRFRVMTPVSGVENDEGDEGSPLLSRSFHHRAETFGGYGSANRRSSLGNDGVRAHLRSPSHSRRNSSRASSLKNKILVNPFGPASTNSYNVNYPPSMPGSPRMRPSDRHEISFGDLMLRDERMESDHGSPRRGSMDGGSNGRGGGPGPFQPSPLDRRHKTALQHALQAEEDVCFPQEGLSELGDEELRARDLSAYRMKVRRRRVKWPDLAILEDWSRIEKEGRSEERRAKKITEPQLINGRLRPLNNKGWYRSEDDAPYRFTYFNEEFPSTIHSQTISEMVQPEGTFKELFSPDPSPLWESSDDDKDEMEEVAAPNDVTGGNNGESRAPTRQPSLTNTMRSFMDVRQARVTSPSLERQGSRSHSTSKQTSGSQTPPTGEGRSPSRIKSPQAQIQPTSQPTTQPTQPRIKQPRYGDRPVWWLDVLSPTEAEMKVISKAFGIHPLTAEDIMMQEQREKVELFRHYYFISYRTFDQDQNSAAFLEPVNMYIVVFRECVISFHFNMTPHPANVRRRIRQLRDYLVLSSDWIGYAIIDDITDAFGPLIQAIEDEVDDIDDEILQLHSEGDYGDEQSCAMPPSYASTPFGSRRKESGDSKGNENSGEATSTATHSGRGMLRRVGDCRKKVMSLYRLLGNKADVIKGFAKRCNEHWEVAPRSEIGLYLGDIQDHIVTMTANLSHYEKILSRSHGNYLAQINIRMNERQEQTADVLGKLTVLGTIVLPMNIITGLWGMNVWVPGQEHQGDLKWFGVITAGLLFFGLACYLIAKRVYKIV